MSPDPSNDVNTLTNCAECSVAAANIFVALVAHKAQKDVVKALESCDVKNAMYLL
jgi:hypothetical protein